MNAAVYPLMANKQYSDFFLQSTNGPEFSRTNCYQMHTSDKHCVGYFWNACRIRDTNWHPHPHTHNSSSRRQSCRLNRAHVWQFANASAREYFVEHIVSPLALAPGIDGVFYDAFNYGYDIPEVRPSSTCPRLLTYLLTYSLADFLADFLADLLTYSLAYLPTYLPTYSLAYLPSDLPACLLRSARGVSLSSTCPTAASPPQAAELSAGAAVRR